MQEFNDTALGFYNPQHWSQNGQRLFGVGGVQGELGEGAGGI